MSVGCGLDGLNKIRKHAELKTPLAGYCNQAVSAILVIMQAGFGQASGQGAAG
ncbi:hypothetical protein [Desulfosarcina widdelii]|nr:hypothetical protein [Desulfosarcina widdelii]